MDYDNYKVYQKYIINTELFGKQHIITFNESESIELGIIPVTSVLTESSMGKLSDNIHESTTSKHSMHGAIPAISTSSNIITVSKEKHNRSKCRRQFNQKIILWLKILLRHQNSFV